MRSHSDSELAENVSFLSPAATPLLPIFQIPRYVSAHYHGFYDGSCASILYPNGLGDDGAGQCDKSNHDAEEAGRYSELHVRYTGIVPVCVGKLR